jgi:hypothetical protein
MGIRLYKPYTAAVHVIDLFQILVKLHNQARKVIDSTITVFKGRNNRGLLVDIVVVHKKVLPHNRFKTTKVGVPGKVLLLNMTQTVMHLL